MLYRKKCEYVPCSAEYETLYYGQRFCRQACKSAWHRDQLTEFTSKKNEAMTIHRRAAVGPPDVDPTTTSDPRIEPLPVRSVLFTRLRECPVIGIVTGLGTRYAIRCKSTDARRHVELYAAGYACEE